MSDIAIRAENLSKKFFLGERIGFKTFRETLQDAVVSPIRRIISGKANGVTVEEKVDTDRQIWALKDVSFEVKHGEVLGIIGPNGAGKSTLLKILSRITEPTGGYAEIRGRVGILLEVGTGFHPELTGRENVYLNGAILGMSKAEIRRKFDDIVSFAGVEKFIDTPVKRYSSGMQVRLAFAVAAHLEPEILIIDEVLAVGDAEFQKRCLGKMNEVSRSGRTVLFVSHNMAAVEGLCTKGLLLDHGKIVCYGAVPHIIERYTASSNQDNAEWSSDDIGLLGHPIIKRVFLTENINSYMSTTAFRTGANLTIVVELDNIRPRDNLQLSYRINDRHGRRLLTCNNVFQHPSPIKLEGQGAVACTIHKCRLLPGAYRLEVRILINGRPLPVEPCLTFRVLQADLYGTGRCLPEHTAVWAPEVSWSVAPVT
ncbi:MAG: ABC transporter ATP-binding protein [Thermogutta sp.]